MKIAMLGTAADMTRVPFGDPEWEIWGLNDLYLKLPPNVHVHRWFELHGDTPLTRSRRPVDHWEQLAALNIPVYSFDIVPSVQRACLFPLDDVLRLRPDPYFACTFAYQIAFALTLGATTLALYGAPLIGAREALVERPCVEWWLGYACGRGVTVLIEHAYPMGTGKHPFLYAWQDQMERRLTYQFVRWHHEGVTEWLTSEEVRLGLAMESQGQDATIEEQRAPWWRRLITSAAGRG